MPHDAAVCLQKQGPERRTNGQTTENTQCRYETHLHAGEKAGLTRFEGVIDWARDSSLPCEQGAAEAHVVSGISDAELGQQQLPGWLLHQESFSPTSVLQPAEEAVAAPERLSLAVHSSPPCL